MSRSLTWLSSAAPAIVLLICIWLGFFQHVPRDAGDVAISAGITSMLVNRAVAERKPTDVLFEESQQYDIAMRFSKETLDVMAFSTPLWHLLLSLGFAFFGVSHSVAFIISSLTATAAVVLTYWLGRELYSRTVGYVAAIYLSTSLFFVVLSRSVIGYAQMSTVAVLLLLLLFYRAHRKGSVRALRLLPVALAFTFLNGYSQGYIVVPIVGVYWLWDTVADRHVTWRALFLGRKKDPREWGIVHLTGVGLVGTALFTLMTLAWDGLLRAAPFTTLGWMYGKRMTRVGFTQTADFATHVQSVRTFFSDMFIGIDPEFSLQGVHIDTVFLREPMVHPILAVLFVVGLVVVLRRRQSGDRLCLAWFAVSLLAATQLAGFVNRHFASAIPAVYLLAAVGTVRAYESASEALARLHVRAPRRVAAVAVGALIAYTGYYTFSNVFNILYARMDGNIYRLYGQSQIADFILANGDPQDSLVVLGDDYITPADAFYFYTRGRGYHAVSWWDGVVRGAVGDISLSAQAERALREWELRSLADRRQIFFVFPVGAYYNEKPGWNLAVPVSAELFHAVHGGLAPEKRVYSTSGIPIFDIYRITRDTPRSWEARFSVSGNESGMLRAAHNTAVEALQITGPARDLQVLIGGETLRTPVTLGPHSEARLTFDRYSFIDVHPTLDPTWLEIEASERSGVHAAAGPLSGTSAVEHTGKSGRLIYRIEAPAPIWRLEVRTNPRILNDGLQLNSISGSFSDDGQQFQPLYRVSSNANGRWGRYENFHIGASDTPGLYEYETYDVLAPASKVCYVAFAFEGIPGQVQMIASTDRAHPFSFKAFFDTSNDRRPALLQGVNRLEFKKQLAGAATVTVVSNDFVTANPVPEATALHEGTMTSGSTQASLNAGVMGAMFVIGAPHFRSNP